ncbi:MAG: HD domain-containing protein [Sphingobacteriales bacterium]|nr:HD domain-containing protein [Sphingobacteriales bacterium]
MLHDVVEDTPITIEQVERKFGKTVADMVAGASEPEKHKRPTMEGSWQEETTYHRLFEATEANLDKLLVSCAINWITQGRIKQNFMELGDKFWERFNAGKEDQIITTQAWQKLSKKEQNNMAHP